MGHPEDCGVVFFPDLPCEGCQGRPALQRTILHCPCGAQNWVETSHEQLFSVTIHCRCERKYKVERL